MANSLERDARNLAEATLRLVSEARDFLSSLEANGYDTSGERYALDDAEGEAKNILARTVGA